MPRQYTTIPAPERFWTKVGFNGPVPEYAPELGACWLWTAYTGSWGYGKFWISSRKGVRPPRYAYEFCVGPIPEGLTLDHLCRVRACVNPDHLEPVTNRENILRGCGVAATNARKTHCLRGHAFTKANTYIPYFGRRICRTCRRLRTNARQAREVGR